MGVGADTLGSLVKGEDMNVRWVVALCTVLALGCSREETRTVAETPAPSFPALPRPQALSPKVDLYDVQLTGVGPGQNMRLWIYLPRAVAKPQSLPLVVIAPAGSNLVSGMDLGDGDRDEHLPYVHAGFAVVAYSIDGVSPEQQTNAAIIGSMKAYRASHAGLVNARNAIDYCLSKVPAINPQKIFTAGHSSAGTIAILLAQNDSRIRACVAYAPVIDVESRLGDGLSTLDRADSGFADFIRASSPQTQLDKIRCPILLFSAEDDDNVPCESVRTTANDLKSRGKLVELKTVKTGGHYDSMIEQGIPAGIAWLKGK